ncbi:hypothetical protein HBH70_208110 [Parastagonospora nodorum]|nr:hypothetical protein HBH51_093750 [Parastagonospora nodorum]KAH3979159.1 hypothetical protein HBH52_101720 [Parastagonospora nodorum]KAH4035021.1 hypothetical protein HBI09_094190 [Parastagonospora nodorum]KAH4065942.1 hypothetical protein HBH50_152600 [Parastagonospora nodorum]KAH4079485.1 hypothetical protein HBH48_219380 [Parastagonospora nodorum]
MSDRYEWRGNGDISGPRATAGFAVSGRASEDNPNPRYSASSSLHGFHPDRDRLYERKAPDNWYAHDSDTDNILGYPEQEGVEATRDEDHKQRYAEKNARIEALKFEVEKIRHEDLQLQADTRRGEEKLAKMKSELKRLQPQQTKEQPPEFYMRPAKVKKGKKK